MFDGFAASIFNGTFMTFQFNSFAAIFLLAGALTSGVLVYAIRHRQVKGAFYFALLVVSVTVWIFPQALEYAVAEPAGKILFAKIQYFGISTIGMAWYLFSLSYNRKENWLGKNYFLLLVLPVFTVIAAFTNELHHLLWPQITPISSLPGANLIYSHGPIFWGIFIYNYILLAMGTVTIIRTALNSREIYRWQMIGLIVSAIVPWIGNVIYVSGASPIPGLDLTPLGFALSAITIAWSIFFLRLFDLVPIARDQLVENLIDGVIVLDSYNRVADINPKARELLGIQNISATGHNIIDFLQPWPDVVERFRDVNEGQTEIHVGNGEVSDIDVRISPLLDAQKHLVGRIVTLRDISRQKKLEKMRENLTQAVVHDLRNPLTSVVMALEMLQKQAVGALPKEQYELLDISQKNSQRMLELVNSILDINRLENGEMPLNCKKVSLYGIATEAAKTISIMANRKRLLLHMEISKGMPDVFVDSELMRRVFQNLLDNSVKFSMEGGVVRIQAGFEPREDAFLVSVSDTGTGIDAAIRENLFGKFISGKGKGSGSGLGLAFCRLVVEAHGGHIWFDEEYQGGTKISLTIPNHTPKWPEI
jgi:PAS domain S-box-containing protein